MSRLDSLQPIPKENEKHTRPMPVIVSVYVKHVSRDHLQDGSQQDTITICDFKHRHLPPGLKIKPGQRLRMSIFVEPAGGQDAKK